MVLDLFDLLQIEMRAEIRIVVTQVRGETIHPDILGTVRAADRDKLPAFAMHGERFLECARAQEFDYFHATTFPFRASTSAR